MDALKAIAECVRLHSSRLYDFLVSQFKGETVSVSGKSDEVVNDVIWTIITAEKGRPLLRHQLKNTIEAESWKETIAKAILSNLEQAVTNGLKEIGRAIQIADEVVEELLHFAADHPILCTLVAIGVSV